MDIITTMNFILCVVIVVLAIVTYGSKKSVIALYVGAAFGLFGISHFVTLIGLASELTDLLLVIRTLAYLTVIVALYRLWKQ